MCLAKVYLEAGPAGAATPGPSALQAAGSAGLATGGIATGPAAAAAAAPPLLENVTRVDVDGQEISLRSLFGEQRVVRGRIASIDFAEGKLFLEGVEALRRP